jgi:sec-independent protein translocase protein TatA
MFEGLFQPTHLILILGIALLLFGPRKLPELGKGLGTGIRGFREALRGMGNEPEPSAEKKELPRNATAEASNSPKPLV